MKEGPQALASGCAQPGLNKTKPIKVQFLKPFILKGKRWNGEQTLDSLILITMCHMVLSEFLQSPFGVKNSLYHFSFCFVYQSMSNKEDSGTYAPYGDTIL